MKKRKGKKGEIEKKNSNAKPDDQRVRPRQPELLPGSNTFAKGADLPNNNNPKVDTTGDLQTAKA